MRKWPHEADGYTIDPIRPEHGMAFYGTREQAGNACQARYEQELRDAGRGSSGSPKVQQEICREMFSGVQLAVMPVD